LTGRRYFLFTVTSLLLLAEAGGLSTAGKRKKILCSQ